MRLTVIVVSILVCTAPRAAWGGFVFSTDDSTLAAQIVVDPLSIVEHCTGALAFADAGFACGIGGGFRAFSSITLNRCCVQDCDASVSGTLIVTAYADPGTGEPLAPSSGGVPASVFPVGTKLVLPLAEAVAMVGSNPNGTASADLVIGAQTASAFSAGGSAVNDTASIDSVDVTDGSGIAIHASASHVASAKKIGYARILCGTGISGTAAAAATDAVAGVARRVAAAAGSAVTLMTPTALDMSTLPVENSTWGRIKALYKNR